MNSPITLIRNVVVDGGTRCHALIRRGRITGLSHEIADAELVIDGNGGRLIPGLVDHHIHLLAAAAALNSFDFGQMPGADAVSFDEKIRELAAIGPVRMIGYSDDSRPILDRRDLDELSGSVPVRVQYRTGGLWVMNSAALDLTLVPGSRVPAEFERDEHDRLTGRVWRGDRFIRNSVRAAAPTLEQLGKDLVRWGVTGVTDASETTTQDQAAIIAQAAKHFPQRLCLMSGTSLSAAHDAQFSVGPIKIMLDEHDLPNLDDVISKIGFARSQRRSVAAHCVTPTELAFMIAAFKSAGTLPGDRIEHGSLIPEDAIPVLKDLKLTVVTQPAFVFTRGDRYLRTVPADQHQDLYRLNSLVQADIRVAAGSDAPYGPANPWIAIRAAMDRRTRQAAPLGEREIVDLDAAIALYGAMSEKRDRSRQRIQIGMLADLCLLRADVTWPEEDPVALTLIGGVVAYLRGNTTISGNLCAPGCAAAR